MSGAATGFMILASGVAGGIVLGIISAIVIEAPALWRAACDVFAPELEDEEAKLVASRQRRRDLDAAIAHQIQADSLDRKRLAEMLATMPSPRNAQTRIH